MHDPFFCCGFSWPCAYFIQIRLQHTVTIPHCVCTETFVFGHLQSMLDFCEIFSYDQKLPA